MRAETKIVTAGRHPELNDGAVNPPVVRTSTVISRTMAEWEMRNKPGFKGASYGRLGTATAQSFEEAIAALEGGDRSLVFPSGLAANIGAIMPFVKAGDHILLPDTIYGPVRRFADNRLTRLGIAIGYYDPLDASSVRRLTQSNTRLVYLEAPGSLTFEMQDVPALTREAHAGGAVVVMDNTWATPLYFRPLDHGVDVSIQSATKYIVGHSDVMIGVVTTTAAVTEVVRASRQDFGQISSPDDVYLAQRGLRTMHVRLKQHWAAGLILAEWLAAQPEVMEVFHPALPTDPGHALWKRDFAGASGLFGFAFKPIPAASAEVFVDSLSLFGIGASWGGYESLIMPIHLERQRTVMHKRLTGPAFRIHAGLENTDDLLEDLAKGFEALRTARRG
jgi:cysteine-S-conjugate beta-lyase